MNKVPLSEIAIQKAAESRREEAVNRLNAGITSPSNDNIFSPPKSLKLRRQSKRNEAFITCVVLTAVVGLSIWIHPVDWRLAVGCLCAGIGMALGGLLERNGHVGLALIAFLAAIGLFVWSAAKFGAMGPMVWAQSLPLMGLGAFGSAYVLFDKFDFKEWDFAVRSKVR